MGGDIVTMQKKRLMMNNAFSPIQRVIGFMPRIPGGLFSRDAANRSQTEHVRLGASHQIDGNAKGSCSSFS